MKYEARSCRRHGGLSDEDDKGCGYLAMTADTEAEREWLTAIYFVNTRDEKRKLKALSTIQKWLTDQRKQIVESVKGEKG